MVRSLKGFLLGSLLLVAACDKVKPGEVGILVDLYGSDKGVQNEVLSVGRYWVGFTKELFTFPTFVQNYVYSASPHEGGPKDESMSFNSSEGLLIKANVGVNYQLEPAKVPAIFQKFRVGVDEITHVFLRNEIRNAFVLAASTRKIEDIYGSGKADFVTDVNARIKASLSGSGINVHDVYLVGDFVLPEQVIGAINAKIAAIQNAERTRNEIESSKAEAQKTIEQAKGEAEKKRIEADALANYNQTVAKSITPELTKYLQITKWDGKLPQVTGSAIPMINLEK